MNIIATIPTIPTTGTFHARNTRDGEALARDGQTYVDANQLDPFTWEIQFADGMWMLATPGDLL